jgi:hypothetical protein
MLEAHITETAVALVITVGTAHRLTVFFQTRRFGNNLFQSSGDGGKYFLRCPTGQKPSPCPSCHLLRGTRYNLRNVVFEKPKTMDNVQNKKHFCDNTHRKNCMELSHFSYVQDILRYEANILRP